MRRRLYDWRSEDQKRKPEERQHRTLTLEEFRALCDEAGGIVSWEHALDYFHHTGVVFYRPDLFSNRIVLDQDWALDAVYTVFHRGRAAPWLRDSGRFTREDLALMVWQEHSLEEQRLFLGLMESCGVCFPCGKTAQGETRYVAPDLLPRFEAVAGRLHAWKEEPGTPTLRLEYRFFHPAVIRGLMSKIGQQAGDLAEYWKYGLWLKDGRRDTQLLLQFVDTSTDEAPGAGALELKAQGRDPLGLLREIRKAILQQRIGEKPEELLTLGGHHGGPERARQRDRRPRARPPEEAGPRRSLRRFLRGPGALREPGEEAPRSTSTPSLSPRARSRERSSSPMPGGMILPRERSARRPSSGLHAALDDGRLRTHPGPRPDPARGADLRLHPPPHPRRSRRGRDQRQIPALPLLHVRDLQLWQKCQGDAEPGSSAWCRSCCRR